MSHTGLTQFRVYRESLELFDLAVDDMRKLRDEPLCFRLVSQQIACVDSICSNIEEGYGRLGRREFVRFLDIARGSAREAQGRYHRMRHWLSPETVADRLRRTGIIIGGLTKTIERLRIDSSDSGKRFREDSTDDYGTDFDT